MKVIEVLKQIERELSEVVGRFFIYMIVFIVLSEAMKTSSLVWTFVLGVLLAAIVVNAMWGIWALVRKWKARTLKTSPQILGDTP